MSNKIKKTWIQELIKRSNTISKRKIMVFTSALLFFFAFVGNSLAQKELRVVYFSSEPPAVVPYRAFDPDSYAVINYIFDKLVGFDYEGTQDHGLLYRGKE